jgi:hypothetical protein
VRHPAAGAEPNPFWKAIGISVLSSMNPALAHFDARLPCAWDGLENTRMTLLPFFKKAEISVATFSHAF